MPLLEIRIAPDPVLRRRAREIKVINSAIRKLAQDMIATMQESHGVGLAANQVGVLKRLIVLQLPDEDPRIMINPEITRRIGERQIDEGCLSLPGYVGLVTRSLSIKARALDEWGAKLRISAEELLAQAIEHEVDHLNGILYVDHLVAHEQLRKIERPSETDASADVAATVPTIDASTPHSHDVTYIVQADHETAKRADGADRPATGNELLIANAKLAGLTRDALAADLTFDLHTPKGATTSANPKRRVMSDNPAINGGAIIENSSAAHNQARKQP